MQIEPVVILERRMALFIGHVTGRDNAKIRPLYLALSQASSREAVGELLMRRLTHWEFQKDHMQDLHDSKTCGMCNQLWDRARSYEGKVREFVYDHLELIAHCELKRSR